MRFKILMLAVFVIATANLAYACSCQRSDPRSRYDRAEIIVIGTVTEVDNDAIKLQVEKRYKGSIEDRAILTKREQETTCDIFFRKGEKYLVYVYKVEFHGKTKLMTDVCAGTSTYSSSKEEITYLETPEPSPNLGKLVTPEEKKVRQKQKRRTKQ